MQIYNTLTRKKEELKTITPGKVKIYSCGPTVYNLIHIGNARPICVFDTLRRYLEYRGYEVDFVQNYTDVDDKIIRRANEENVPACEISERYIKEYITDAHGLNVLDATIHPKVTENMDAIIDFIQSLIAKGYAYEAGGDVYFRTAKFAEYGKLDVYKKQMYTERAKRDGIVLLYEEPDQVSPFFGDKNRLRQVFINIIDNALKYSDAGDTVTISIEEKDGFLYIRVADTGCGISEEDLPKIKKKFFKANQTRRGSGIGLAVANEIIVMHGGEIDIESKLDVGTTVTIVLPVVKKGQFLSLIHI